MTEAGTGQHALRPARRVNERKVYSYGKDQAWHHGPPQAVPEEVAPAAVIQEAEPAAEPGRAREREAAMVGVHGNGSGGNGVGGNGSGDNGSGRDAVDERDTSAVRG